MQHLSIAAQELVLIMMLMQSHLGFYQLGIQEKERG